MLRRIVLDRKCLNFPHIYAEKIKRIQLRKGIILCSSFHSQVPVRAKQMGYFMRKRLQEKEAENEIPAILDPTEVTAESIFRSLHEEDRELTCAEWDIVTEKILGKPDSFGKLVKPINISSVIFKICESNNTINIAKSWADYSKIWDSPDQIKLGPALKMAVAVDMKDQEELVLRIANHYLSQGIENIVLVNLYWSSLKLLAKTSQWEKGVEMINQYKNTNKDDTDENQDLHLSYNLHPHVIVPFGIRALQSGNKDLLFQLMEKPEFHEFQNPLRLNVSSATPHQEELYRFIINYSYDTEFRREGARLRSRLYEYLSKYQLHISEELSTLIKDHNYYIEDGEKRHEIKTLTKIDYQTGECLNCTNKLTRTGITNAEYESLKTGILETVLVGDDIYKNTDPRELKDFLRRVSKENYDIVIDGMNVSYYRVKGLKTAYKPTGIASANLLETVAYFYKQGKRIMVMHRPEIKNFPHYPEIDSMARVHLVGKVSQDDPYFLLASLYSKCLFLTNDMLRQHMYLLARKDRKLAQLFTRWQVSHQTFILGFNHNKKSMHTGSPILMFPPAHDVNTTKTDEYWHIPLLKCEEKSKYVTISNKTLYHGLRHEWICLGPKMKTPSKLKLSRQEVAWPEWAHTPTTPTDNQPKDQFYGSFRKKITDLDMKKDEKRNDNKKYLKYISKKKK